MAAIAVTAVGAADQQHQADSSEVFRKSIVAYLDIVTPRCASEMIRVYTNYATDRDRAFVSSLTDETRATYQDTKRKFLEHDQRVVYECGLWPPPSPPPGAATDREVSKRQFAIERGQKTFESQARGLPQLFDSADAAFEKMVSAYTTLQGER